MVEQCCERHLSSGFNREQVAIEVLKACLFKGTTKAGVKLEKGSRI